MSDSETELPSFSLSGFLKTFNNNAGQRSSDSASVAPSSKSRATPKAATAKAKTTPRCPPSSRTRQPTSAADHKVLVGNAGNGNAAKRRSPTAGIDPFNEEQSPEKKKHRTSDDNISEADIATLGAFAEKILPLKSISPPVADAAFKANLVEHLQKMSTIMQELKVKKKSAERRNGSKTNKSDMLFLEKLSHMDVELKEMQKLIRCSLASYMLFVY